MKPVSGDLIHETTSSVIQRTASAQSCVQPTNGGMTC